MSADPLERAEPLTALAMLRGELAPLQPTDETPFDAFIAYVAARCPRYPSPARAAEDVSQNAHFDLGLHYALCIASEIARDLRAPRPNARLAILASTRIRLLTLRDYCARLEKENLGFLSFDVEGVQECERVVFDAIRLRQQCDVGLSETNDKAALAALADDADGQVRAGRTEFLPFALGARQVIGHSVVFSHWVPGNGPLGVIKACLDVGGRLLAERDRAVRAESSRAARNATGGGELDDDRAGIVRLPRTASEPDAVEPERPGVVVFPATIADAAGKNENTKEIKRTLGDALGTRLPLVSVPEDWDAWEDVLISGAPWLAPAVRAVRASQGGRSHWGGGVVCLEGGAGAGKSRLARRIAETSGLPFARYNCDASSDNSGLGGTSIRWMSAHPGVVERLLASSHSGNGVVLLDEIEKASGSRRTGGGEPHDLMHGLFEPETARAWRSPYLLAEIDVSHVLYLATANETASLPSSLRDRMRIVRVPEPGPEHLGLLAPTLAREACRGLGLDERWGTLDGEELFVLREAWKGGSIRRLARLVQGLLQARDGAPVARH